MTSHDDENYTPVTQPLEMRELLESLSAPGAASLVLEKWGSRTLPVVVAHSDDPGALLLDITAIREVAAELRRGAGFRVVGQARGGMLRTPVLGASRCWEEGDRLYCHCDYPEHLEIMQRRDTFRAALRLGMDVGVIVRDRDNGLSAQGDLKDLSLAGCLVELSSTAMSALLSNSGLFELELCFPSGTRFVIKGSPRHQKVDTQRGLVNAGFAFEACTVEDDRQLWFYVREIEREAARMAGSGRASLRPSLLFEKSETTTSRVGRRNTQEYATPMARRLARTAAYLDNQILELRQGGMIDPVQLSRQADRLLALRDENREALLFAVHCLERETQLVRHCLAVAVRLVDFASAQKMPHELCKAMAAAAMAHDLGKALLPRDLLEMPVLSASQYRWMQGHVALAIQRLEPCRWLSSSVVEAVVRDINERLDGSGYPHGRGGDDLSELARLASVVDVVDAMGRARPGRKPWPMGEIYRYLADSEALFDPRWVSEYRRHFGDWPVGSLVRYRGGLLGWVRRLDDAGLPVEVQLSHGKGFPGPDGEDLVAGEALRRLGEPEATVAAPA